MKIAQQLFLTLFIISFLSLDPISFCQTPGSSAALAEPHHQAQFPALLQDGFQRWDHGYLITHAWTGTLETSPSKPGVILYDERDRLPARQLSGLTEHVPSALAMW